jgi:hypothetical protein
MTHARLVSGASNGLVQAELTEPLRANGETFLEPGVVLVGRGTSTEERLFVRFDQVVLKNGSIEAIDAHACDKKHKIVGLKGSKVGKRVLNIAGSIGLGFIGGMAEGLQETKGQQGVVIKKPTLKNSLLNATSTTALEQSRNLMGGLKNKNQIIEVSAGTEICVIIGRTQ